MPGTSTPFLALLRGLNVGGQNVIGKHDLIRCFEDLGFESVGAYIQSGNVLFRSSESRAAALTRTIEAALSERLTNQVRAVVLTRTRYRTAVASAPDDWGRGDDRKHNAAFTLSGVTPRQVIEQRGHSARLRGGSRPARAPVGGTVLLSGQDRGP